MLIATKPERIFRGNGVSPGIALGHALKLDNHNRVVLKLLVDENHVEDEVLRLKKAVEASREQLETLKESLEKKVGPEHSFILDVHLLMLEDRILIEDIINLIRSRRANAEWAVRRATDRIRDAYRSLDDEYFRERGSDIENVVERLLLNLSGDRPIGRDPLPQDLIVVSHSFSPAGFASMNLQKLLGLALETGGRTSHTAIIARSLRIPAVMEIADSLSSISTGDLLLVNGNDGELIVNPTAERLETIREPMIEWNRAAEPALQSGGNRLKDGSVVTLQANTELPHEVKAAKRAGAEGIGLFRTEMLFLGRAAHPTMEEQLKTYSELARQMSPYPVSIRTLDTGTDKLDSDRGQVNPSMGLRGIRLSLVAREQLFAPQVEAILRASTAGKVEIVLPMISTVEEIWESRRTIQEISGRLASEGVSVAQPSVPLGAMIEVPAAVLSLDSIAAEVDFLCVGTNDLIQYILAVDRGDPRVSHLFQPLHPSVLRCLRRIAEVSLKLGKPVRICGEMSSNPFFVVLLIGMGFTQLSMNSLSLRKIRSILGDLTTEDCRRIANRALETVTAKQTAEHLIEEVSRLVHMDLTSYVKEVRTP
jgi:phosphotransferase system enzyme I (PtsI)